MVGDLVGSLVDVVVVASLAPGVCLTVGLVGMGGFGWFGVAVVASLAPGVCLADAARIGVAARASAAAGSSYGHVVG